MLSLLSRSTNQHSTKSSPRPNEEAWESYLGLLTKILQCIGACIVSTLRNQWGRSDQWRSLKDMRDNSSVRNLLALGLKSWGLRLRRRAGFIQRRAAILQTITLYKTEICVEQLTYRMCRRMTNVIYHQNLSCPVLTKVTFWVFI